MAYKVRIVANACISRYNGGEREMADIVASYNFAPSDAELVLAEIISKRPDIEV